MIIIYLLLGVLAGALLSYLVIPRVWGKAGADAADGAEAEGQKILDAARAEAEAIRKDALVKGKELAFGLRAEVEEEIRGRRTDLAKQEEALSVREEQAEKRARDAGRREEDLQKKEKTIAAREQAAEAMARQAEQAVAEAKARLEKVAGMTAAEARQKLADQMIDEARKLAAAEVKRIETTAQEEAAEKAKKVIGTAIQRFASEYVAERTVAVVPLPSDDMKGRLIGREGRNVRALEAATGIDLIIDDTPEAITISCFNPIRREIARLAIGRLVADGRIHPTRIEEVVAKCEEEVQNQCKEAGEQAVFDLGLHRVHPELIKLLGGLKYRSSYAQNLLAHSIEVGFLAGIMAAELGLNIKQARRAGLFHDIGKAVDHQQEGSHAVVGAQLLKKYGESPRICQAVAAHHDDVPQEGVLDHVVDAANRLSGQRPGARRETLESYIKRLHDLEALARGYKGVDKAFAIQAGREVRVVVENGQINDEQAILLSKDIARKIETEMSYPGQVRVCVIRETRATDYAR
ncbi:MAG: ribonuclease Y [Deltaproteobacteria bacterium]|nr:ribonuclease Y [Deltaproteobacteria bacterium]